MKTEKSKATRKCELCNKKHIHSGEICAVFNYQGKFGPVKISYSIKCLKKFSNKNLKEKTPKSKTYSRKEVAAKMELSYNKALIEIHHPLFDKDQWIEENL